MSYPQGTHYSADERREDEANERLWRYIKLGVGTVMATIVVGMAGCPYYSVWQQGLAGEAALARATQDKQIAIQEALAKKDSAKMLAEAEVERARGVAEANQIIGNSLEGKEAYLRYLWIDGLKTNNMQVVYVPTEAGLPILEAGKRPQPQN